MCETSNTPASRPHRAVLGDHALVLDGHLPAGERDHPRAGARRGGRGAACAGASAPRAMLTAPGPAAAPGQSSRRNDGTSSDVRASSNSLRRADRRRRARLGRARAPAGGAAAEARSRSRSRAPRRAACSSITAPKITFAFWSAALVTTSAASFTSKRPRSGGPVMLSRIPVAPSIDDSRSGELTAVRAASRGAVLALADADAHQRRAGVAHDRAHVGEVEVDDARAR